MSETRFGMRGGRMGSLSWWRDSVRLELPARLDGPGRRRMERMHDALARRGVRGWELDASRMGARDALSLARLASLCATARHRGSVPRVTGLPRDARRWLTRAELHVLVPLGAPGGGHGHVDPAHTPG